MPWVGLQLRSEGHFFHFLFLVLLDVELTQHFLLLLVELSVLVQPVGVGLRSTGSWLDLHDPLDLKGLGEANAVTAILLAASLFLVAVVQVAPGSFAVRWWHGTSMAFWLPLDPLGVLLALRILARIHALHVCRLTLVVAQIRLESESCGAHLIRLFDGLAVRGPTLLARASGALLEAQVVIPVSMAHWLVATLVSGQIVGEVIIGRHTCLHMFVPCWLAVVEKLSHRLQRVNLLSNLLL